MASQLSVWSTANIAKKILCIFNYITVIIPKQKVKNNDDRYTQRRTDVQNEYVGTLIKLFITLTYRRDLNKP